MAELTMVEAINLALKQEMDSDDRVLVLGEDVGVDGGVFRVTEGLIDEFGEERSMDTPVAEAGIVGMSIGMAIYGLRPVCEMQFSGFSYFAFHQIESHAARMRWRSRGRHTIPMVVRMPYGGGVHALEHHSESREVVYAHTPGDSRQRGCSRSPDRVVHPSWPDTRALRGLGPLDRLRLALKCHKPAPGPIDSTVRCARSQRCHANSASGDETWNEPV